MTARFRFGVLFLLALGGCGSLDSSENGCDLAEMRTLAEAPAARVAPVVERRVLAFYYPWYGTPTGPSQRWVHWPPAAAGHGIAHTPSSGYYDSRDPLTVLRHVREAKQAGIDGFIASWWGPGLREDQALEILLRVAEAEGFLVTAMVERAQTCSGLNGSVSFLVDRRAASPAWLRADGRPVVFLYGQAIASLGPTELRASLQGTGAFVVGDQLLPQQAEPFDGVFAYNPIRDVGGYLQQLPGLAAAHRSDGRLFAATVVPGYDDTVIRQPGLRVDRQDGRLYQQMWGAAGEADWILITSWNEWHEGTEIEPSLEYGPSYLTSTRTLSDIWRR